MKDGFDGFTMAQAKRDFNIGYMESFKISRAPMSPGWCVEFKAGTARGPLVDARDKSPRVFKSLDAVVAAVESVGFKVDLLS